MALGYIMLYNHSAEPNIELESDLNAKTITAMAIKNIKAGEELTWDYGCEIWFDTKK
jgi:SET domain-containing protein